MNDTIDQATTTCRECGQSYFYEPVMIGNVDFGKTLHPLCEGCRRADEKQNEEREKAERAARAEAAIATTLEPDLLDTDTSRPDFERDLWRAVAQWRPNSEHRWLGIVGRAGHCKTRCMTLYAARVIRYGLRIAWTSAPRLADVAAEYRHSDEKIRVAAREHFQDCLTAPYLFIDDLGKNEWTSAFEARLFQLLDHRKNRRLPVVYSSNVHPESFSISISDANREPIIGRLLDRTLLLEI